MISYYSVDSNAFHQVLPYTWKIVEIYITEIWIYNIIFSHNVISYSNYVNLYNLANELSSWCLHRLTRCQKWLSLDISLMSRCCYIRLFYIMFTYNFWYVSVYMCKIIRTLNYFPNFFLINHSAFDLIAFIYSSGTSKRFYCMN